MNETTLRPVDPGGAFCVSIKSISLFQPRRSAVPALPIYRHSISQQRKAIVHPHLPAAFAHVVSITTEAVGTRPTDANKAARTPRLRPVDPGGAFCVSIKSIFLFQPRRSAVPALPVCRHSISTQKLSSHKLRSANNIKKFCRMFIKSCLNGVDGWIRRWYNIN